MLPSSAVWWACEGPGRSLKIGNAVRCWREGPGSPRMGATTVEVSTNHVAMVSHPDEVLQLITTAAETVPAAT